MNFDSIREIDKDLLCFSKALSPSSSLLRRWNGDIHELVTELRNHLSYNKYSIDRHVITGSVSKRACIVQTDYDVVIFFNRVHPPFTTNVIEDLRYILLKLPYITDVRTTKFSVGFIVHGEVKVDLLPATNLIRRGTNLNRLQRIENQRQNTMPIIHGLSADMTRFYASSLSESQVQFMRQQPSHVRVVVKLAKFWYKALCSDRRISVSGLKYLIELVAVYCAQEEDQISVCEIRNYSVTHAIALVFRKLSVTKDLAVMFVDGVGVSERNRATLRRQFVEYRNGFVVDPANPYNNILDSVKYICKRGINGDFKAITLLEENAAQSLHDFKTYLEKYDPTHGRSPWLTLLFKTRISEFPFKEPYPVGVCFTYFSTWNEYAKQTNSIKNPPSTAAVSLIENVFKIGAAIEAYKNRLHNNDDPGGTTEKNIHQQIMETTKNLQNGILEYVETETNFNVRLSEELQEMLHPQGTSRSHPSFRLYSRGGHSLTQVVDKVRRKYNELNVHVFHAETWKGPCIFSKRDYGNDVLYCCCLVLIE